MGGAGYSAGIMDGSTRRTTVACDRCSKKRQEAVTKPVRLEKKPLSVCFVASRFTKASPWRLLEGNLCLIRLLFVVLVSFFGVTELLPFGEERLVGGLFLMPSMSGRSQSISLLTSSPCRALYFSVDRPSQQVCESGYIEPEQ
jgi:hypothetical protein